MSQASAVPSSPKTSGIAIASIVCGFLGFCTAGIAGIVGVILGILTIRKIRQSRGALTGTNYSIAGVVLSVLGGIGGLGVAAHALAVWEMLPFIPHSGEEATALTEVRYAMLPVIRYMEADFSHFPPTATWPSAVQAFTAAQGSPAAPLGSRAHCVVAMNAGLEGLRLRDIKDPAHTVLLFECAPGGPTAGGVMDLPPKPQHASGYIIGFCDGWVITVQPKDIGTLVWDSKSPT